MVVKCRSSPRKDEQRYHRFYVRLLMQGQNIKIPLLIF